MQPKSRESGRRAALGVTFSSTPAREGGSGRAFDSRRGALFTEPTPTDEPSRRKKKILLVDDSITGLMMSQLALRTGPYDFVTARNGKEAIEKALSERPDLIVMDVVMPELNGFQACKKLRSMEPTRATPILLLTSRREEESVANGYATGCTEYLLKPIKGPELLNKVKGYLGE